MQSRNAKSFGTLINYRSANENVSINTIETKLSKKQSIVRLYSRLRFLLDIPLRDFTRMDKLGLFLTTNPYTMLSYARLSKLYDIAMYLEKEKIGGSFVQCGVWNGGSAGVLGEVVKRNTERNIWLFDSWEGLPEPSQVDVNFRGTSGEIGMDLGYEEKVRDLLFKKLNLDNNIIHIVKGWFDDTIPASNVRIGNIALLHLDCDWYESVKFCLEQLYDNVVEGGFVVIDDYGYWKGCRQAVDEFIKTKTLKVDLVKIDDTGIYFQK